MRAPRIACRRSVSASLSLLAIPLLLWPGLVLASDDLVAPTPQMIDLMRQQHSAKDWLRIRSGASRLELRVDRIDSEGLHGLRARKRTPQPSMLPWSSIQRIDRRESRLRTGQVLGLLFGAAAGSAVGAVVANLGDPPPIYGTGFDGSWTVVAVGPSGHPRGALIGLAVGGIATAWLGGKLGDSIVRERPLYVPHLDRSTTEPAATTSALPAAEMDKVRAARIKLGNLLRVTGNFGQFIGRAADTGGLGLSGLQPDPAFDSTLPLPSEPLSWTEISRVERRGNSVNTFASNGGVVLGLATGLLFAAAVAGYSGLSNSNASFGQLASSFTVGSVVGAGAGAGVGALIGLAVPRWNLVYRRPRSQPVASVVR